MAVTAIDLYVFGNQSRPRPPRLGIDIFPDQSGLVGPEDPARNPSGASGFADPLRSSLRGHYHKLPAGTLLPPELGVIADGVDVDPNSHHGPSHHTFFATVAMPATKLVELFLKLPWEYAGKK